MHLRAAASQVLFLPKEKLPREKPERQLAVFVGIVLRHEEDTSVRWLKRKVELVCEQAESLISRLTLSKNMSH